MFDSLSLSDVMGYISIACWLGAQFPQVVENIKLKSCEGLALPFLANWLLGDISNLVGCILTHQLPFQTYLATYFVCVDFMLVVQYYHYYKPPKAVSSSFSHIRSATSPSAIRRMSIERGASRYRALSAAASHVAAAAALAAQQDEHGDRRPSTRYSSRYGRQHNASRTREQEEDEFEEEIPSGMMDSFRSERGPGEHSKRVSWSVERHAGRAASVGRPVVSLPPTALHVISDEPVPFPRSADAQLGSSTQQSSDHVESVSTIISSRGSRASRKGSTMVFLSVWALFGIGTFANQRSAVPSGSTSAGQVLSSTNLYDPTSIPIALAGHSAFSPRDLSVEGESAFDFGSRSSHTVTYNELAVDPHEPHEDPTSEQILGRIFAWLCTTLYLTSRLPQIWKNYARKSVEGLSMYLFVFAFLGNCFYVSSILISPRRFLPPPQSTQYIRESIPYLLGSGGTLIFDMTIVAQSFCYKPRHRRHASAHVVRPFDEEEAGLLSGDALSAHPDSAITNRGLPNKEMPSPSAASLVNPTPCQLRALVLDYLCHSCYTNTASAFNRESTVRQLDADGDEIIDDSDTNRSAGRYSDEGFQTLMQQVRLREEIRTHIMSGRVDDAITLLNTHFPAVLAGEDDGGGAPGERARAAASNVEYISSTSTEPAHLYLNLRILAFSEACRTVPLPYPSAARPDSPAPAPAPAERAADGEEYQEQQMALLNRAQKLYAYLGTLPHADRPIYLKELENVGGLLAYKVPEKSSMAKYLTLERREAVADQINRAILKRTNQPLISSLELVTRHTQVVWQKANEHGVKARPGAVMPPRGRKSPSNDADILVRSPHIYTSARNDQLSLCMPLDCTNIRLASIFGCEAIGPLPICNLISIFSCIMECFRVVLIE
ncbi:hypothetical protein HYPSUDRAFT_131638 [Hypholoma sublateritium FD-334 SS-4]|uniref:CRA domain-containing protein n=1 Tax=Hypholoma sublateritium (strain FD-334 SS-4) TaxID=945553 RepID=A0A0D2P7Z7_HYPSF|nr:hypothetical protein HYPSUDRAFT_131638 [Hypholoma sublateritium FD-334 SS-4]